MRNEPTVQLLRLICIYVPTLIITVLYLELVKTKSYIMAAVFIILAIVCFVFYLALHKSANKDNAPHIWVEQNNMKSTNVKTDMITNLSMGLSTKQKYAVVQLLACIQGASPLSAFGDEANNISERIFSSMGLSKQDVGIFLEEQMNSTISGNPEQQFQNMLSALKSIKDKTFLNNLYQKCMRIAEISGDVETISMTKTIFNHELGIY